MSFTDKLKFWKKHDFAVENPVDEPKWENHEQANPFVQDAQNQSSNPFGQSDSFSNQYGQQNVASQNDPFTQQPNQPMQHDPFAQNDSFTQSSQSQYSQHQTSAQNSGQSDISHRDVDLILSRLDLIKSELENVQHRLANLERQKPKW